MKHTADTIKFEYKSEVSALYNALVVYVAEHSVSEEISITIDVLEMLLFNW